jgi:acyl-CoA hydrolase/GNAT superfamily N-acetyltransferase
MREAYPKTLASTDEIFSRIHPGQRIFVGTGCGEPQYLVQALMQHIESLPKAFWDVEIWTLGITSYPSEKYKRYFRYNSFFIGNGLRDAVNSGTADYTPVFLSRVPDLFHRRMIPVDVAFIQTSLVIAQANSFMPRVRGDGFIPMEDIDIIVPYDEPILEFWAEADTEIAKRIGGYVSKIVQDGDTIQVGYGSIPSTILSSLRDKRHLGIHTELLSDGMVELMKKGVVDNAKKTIDQGKTVASFCMGKKETYDYIDDNPPIEFRTIDYTNSPLVISRHSHMVVINSALQVDLTGQATAESIGTSFYSGVGGQADFMRGALWSPHGKTVLAFPSTARNGTVSRIVPLLNEGAGFTLHRGDVEYVVTEYGIAYLHGKNIRERAMELISIAHPQFRAWLMEEAKKHALIYKDQAFISGKEGEYPEHLETRRTTRKGVQILLRPVRISDEPLLKDLFYSLSDDTRYRRFLSGRRNLPYDLLQKFVGLDYTKQMAILAIIEQEGREEVVGVGRYSVNEEEDSYTADVAFVVRDGSQNKGIGSELFDYLTSLAKRQDLHGFTALVLLENNPMLHMIRKMPFDIEEKLEGDVYELKMMFRSPSRSY